MATIVPNQDFKHERDQYKKGESYDVPNELAFYFKMCGWLVGGPSAPTGKAVTLDVHDVVQGHKSEVK